MKKLLAFLLSVTMCAATLVFGACGGGDSSSSEDTSASDSSAQNELTKADYVEAFTAVQTAMQSSDFATPSAMLTSVTSSSPIGYHGLNINDSDLTENTNEGANQLGIINAMAFNYFFVQILGNDSYSLVDEPIVYAAEETGVATGVLQMVYDGTCLVGQMYMLPNGCPTIGLFSIYIDYDFETNEMLGFEWMLRVAGAPISAYYYYDGEQGYTLADATIVEEYLDTQLATYTHPTDAQNIFDLLAEWTATTEYANTLMR